MNPNGGLLFGAMLADNYWFPRRSASGSTNAEAKHRFSLTALFDKRHCAVHKFFGACVVKLDAQL